MVSFSPLQGVPQFGLSLGVGTRAAIGSKSGF